MSPKDDADSDNTSADSLPPWTSPVTHVRTRLRCWNDEKRHQFREADLRLVAAKQLVFLLIAFGLLIAPYWYVPAASVPGDTSVRTPPVDQPRCVTENPRGEKRSTNITATVEKVPGERAVTIRYDLSNATADTVSLDFHPEGTEVINSSGFDEDFLGHYDSDGRPRPSVTYTYPNTDQGFNTSGRRYAAGDGWAHAPLPATSSHQVSYTVAPNGVVDYNDLRRHAVYIGNLSKETTQLGCQTLVLYTTQGLGIDSERVLTSLRKSASRYEPGQRYRTVRLVISPWNMTTNTGFARGNYSIVSATTRSERLLTTTVVHEYIHTRQINDYGSGVEWMREAVAEYYGARLEYEAGVMSVPEYGRFLTQSAADAEWGGPFSAQTNPNHYRRGAVTLSALDAAIRNATDGKKTLQDVILRLENRSRPILTQRDLKESIATVTNDSLSGWVDRHVANGTAVDAATPGTRTLTATQWQLFYMYDSVLSRGLLYQLAVYAWIFIVVRALTIKISRKLPGLRG
jgi:hypothetical protein